MESTFNNRRYSTEYKDEMQEMRCKNIASFINELNPASVLDIGCGFGQVGKFINKEIKSIGIDQSEDSIAVAKSYYTETYCTDLNNYTVADKFGCIVLSEVIEHVFYTEDLLKKCNSFLIEGGYIIITTPNLGGWINRISLLFGLQPFFTECGVEKIYGNPLRSTKESPAGHIRMFTYRSLIDILNYCDFTVTKSKSIPMLKKIAMLDKILNAILPISFSTDMLIVARKGYTK